MNIQDIKSKERGSIVLYSLLILALILAMVFSILNGFLPRIRLIRESSNSMGAVFAADSILEWCLYSSRAGVIPRPVMSNGATYTITRVSDGLNDCPLDQPLNHRAAGSYQGITRSFEVDQI